MNQFAQVFVSGLATGSIYALLALGIVLLYRTSAILNFAHGEFGLIGAFMTFIFLSALELPYLVSFAASLVIALLLGGVTSLLLIRPGKAALAAGLAALIAGVTYGFSVSWTLAAIVGIAVGLLSYRYLEQPLGKPNELGLIIITLGAGLALQGLYAIIFGTDNKAVPPIVPDRALRLGGAALSQLSLFTSGVGVVIMLGLWLLLNRTKIGLAMRAVAQRDDVAKALGIPVRTVMFATWGVSALLAAAAALLLVPTTLLNPVMMLDPVSKGFVSAVIGGMTSLPGAILGGYVLGVLELFVGVYISNQFKASFAFLVVIIVLIVKPHGILGKPEVKRV
jgi:branched-chain amino acid transport system permease protein